MSRAKGQWIWILEFGIWISFSLLLRCFVIQSKHTIIALHRSWHYPHGHQHSHQISIKRKRCIWSGGRFIQFSFCFSPSFSLLVSSSTPSLQSENLKWFSNDKTTGNLQLSLYVNQAWNWNANPPKTIRLQFTSQDHLAFDSELLSLDCELVSTCLYLFANYTIKIKRIPQPTEPSSEISSIVERSSRSAGQDEAITVAS